MSLSSDSSWLFVAFIGMLIGVIVYHLNKKFHNKIPFSVILLLVGVSIGGIDIALKRKVPFIDIIETLNPMIFMQIFLPNLIFYSVFSTNHHTLMRVKWHALVLAIPGVLINTLLTSIICSYILPYRWNIKISLLFGSIVSATDPVAVVTLLREIKASQNLSTVVETESLFNDASAIILFDVLTLMIIDSQKSKTASFYIFRCLVLLSGSLIGAIFGFITSLYITTVLNDELLETSATFIGINLDFIVADLLKSSGVLATVAMGLVIARNKARFSTRGLANLNHFWELLEFFSKCLIFLISGIIVSYKTINASNVSWLEFGYLLAIYVWIQITRAITLLVLHPVLRFLGADYDWKTACVLWYGSVRGAIGLALSLEVEYLNGIDKSIREKMVFHICGIVVLTLVINGSTIQYVLKLLKIKSSLYQSDFLIKSSLEHLAKKSDHLVNVLSQNNHFTGANWLELRNSIPDYSRLLKTENYGIGGQNEHSVESNIRYRFICSMKSFYWKQHQDGLINSHTYNILNDAAEASIDCNDIKEQWTCIKKHFKYPRWYQFLHSKRFFKNFSHKRIFGIILETVQLSTAFIFAADRTGIIVKKFPEWKSNLTDKVFAEIKAAEKLAELEIHRIQKTFPEIYQSIQSQKASVFVLNSDIKNINRLRKDGIIQTSECEEMTDRVNTFIHKVGSCYKIPAKINTFLLFSNLPFISVFDEQTKHILFAKLRYKVFSEEETLYTEGKNKNSFFLIVRGLVKINTSDHYERIYGPGSLINLWASLAESTSISTCRAQTTTSVLKVPKTVIHSILRERTTEEIAWKCAAFMMMRMLFTTRLELESDHVKLGEICLSSTFRKFESDTDELVGSKVLLLKGKARDVVGKVYIAPALIQSIQTKSLQRINSVTVNRMRVRFSKSVALILDSKGSPFRQTLEDIANVSEESMSELNRNESLGLIYIKGSTESTRTHLSSTNV